MDWTGVVLPPSFPPFLVAIIVGASGGVFSASVHVHSRVCVFVRAHVPVVIVVVVGLFCFVFFLAG